MFRIKRILITCLILLATMAASADTIVFTGGRVLIGDKVEILEDSSNQLSPAEVLKSGAFRQSEKVTPNFDISNSSFWIRFTVYNKTSARRMFLELDYPLIDTCNLYRLLDNELQMEQAAGASRIFNDRKHKHPDFVYDLLIGPDSIQTYYLKIRSSEQLITPLILGDIQTIAEAHNTRDLISGIHIGILLVMIFYNLFVFLSTRDLSYLYYVFYITFIGLTQITLTGYTYKYLYPGSPQFFNTSIVLFPSLAGISAILFIRSFLHTKTQTPVLNKIILFFAGLYALAGLTRIAGFDTQSSRMVDITALTAALFVFIISIKLSLRGYRPAKFFLLAWSIFIVGLMLYVFRNLGILPYSNFTNYTMQAGTAIEVTLLSIALADKINILKREKEISQAEALAAAQENEKIVREQNIMLDAKVKERTFELEESNYNLNVAMDDLKQAQSQLVESEKMASLGQLTAGIAHEINNPINFVTSNVKPLKRDVQILMQILDEIESHVDSDLSPAEKKKRIEELKSEQDFDYLKTEIDYLLKGIAEGSTRTAEIVRGLRIFSRVDEDDIKLADINEGLESTLVIANNLVGNRIKIEKIFGNLPLVECYPGKLNQVFLNMITNGLYALNAKFGDSDGGVLQITTRLKGEGVAIHFKDNGIGMDENTRKKLFEPFFTTKPVGEGTGLGLSIAYNTIKRHNGLVTVLSEAGEGTEFIIEIPVRQPTVAKENVQ